MPRWNSKSKELQWVFWGAKCFCRCARCGGVCKPVKSNEYSWVWLQNQDLPIEEWKPIPPEGDNYFCRPCFLRIQREAQTRRKYFAVNDLIRKINRTKPDGTNQDNRTASPVPR